MTSQTRGTRQEDLYLFRSMLFALFSLLYLVKDMKNSVGTFFIFYFF